MVRFSLVLFILMNNTYALYFTITGIMFTVIVSVIIAYK